MSGSGFDAGGPDSIAHAMLHGRRVVAILRPGDVVVLESERLLSAEQFDAVNSMLKAWSEKNGVGYLLLPHPVKVARVDVVTRIDQAKLEDG